LTPTTKKNPTSNPKELRVETRPDETDSQRLAAVVMDGTLSAVTVQDHARVGEGTVEAKHRPEVG